jgi:hypothetical protein
VRGTPTTYLVGGRRITPFSQENSQKMSDTVTIRVSFPTDENGLVGRQCPECDGYFKIKPGTGLPIESCTCPYCEHEDESGAFLTPAQRDYAVSLAAKRILAPALRDFQQQLRRLEDTTRNSFIHFKVSTGWIDFPVKYYTERDLETEVTCEACGLIFAIYGVFACCPDCREATTGAAFRKSVEVARKRLGLLVRLQDTESELQEALLVDTLASGVAAFDGLGKGLRTKYAQRLPEQPRNLFQNLDALARALQGEGLPTIEQMIGEVGYRHMYRMFQVRHLWEHGFGEVDADFIRKTQCNPSLLRRKYVPTKAELIEFLDTVEQVGQLLQQALATQSNLG